jgi:mannose-6-phosphate isomerase-like protein (cupin superfamily)
MPKPEFYISEGCFITEWSNTPEDPAVSIARARVPPGVTTRWHRLTATTERYVILEGRGRAYVGEAEPKEVGPGDVVLIPAARRQRITNTGKDDLVFLAICTPRFMRDAYEEAEC